MKNCVFKFLLLAFNIIGSLNLTVGQNDHVLLITADYSTSSKHIEVNSSSLNSNYNQAIVSNSNIDIYADNQVELYGYNSGSDFQVDLILYELDEWELGVRSQDTLSAFWGLHTVGNNNLILKHPLYISDTIQYAFGDLVTISTCAGKLKFHKNGILLKTAFLQQNAVDLSVVSKMTYATNDSVLIASSVINDCLEEESKSYLFPMYHMPAKATLIESSNFVFKFVQKYAINSLNDQGKITLFDNKHQLISSLNFTKKYGINLIEVDIDQMIGAPMVIDEPYLIEITDINKKDKYYLKVKK